jgi:transposase
MSATLRYVGLDVHKDSIVIAVAEDGVQPAEFLTKLPYDVPRLLKQLRKLGSAARLRCCYEAGPTGYGLYRALSEAGFACIVVAPSLIPVQSGNRVKTDRRDARKLAHYLRSGDLTAVWVPDEASEAMRDLERARDDAKRSERTARQQLGKFLLRHDRRYPGKTSWTLRHLAWIATQKFAHEAQQQVLTDYLHTVQEAAARVKRLSDQIAKLVEGWALAPLVKALMAMRGVQLITAVTVAAEIGDLKRFRTAGQLMSFVGAVPSERSSGGSRRQGRITKTGNAHVRRVLVEAAWTYRHRPRMSDAICKRNAGLPPQVQAIAWKAQVRLNQRYRGMLAAGKAPNVTVTAVARELAGFVWALGQQVESPKAHGSWAASTLSLDVSGTCPPKYSSGVSQAQAVRSARRKPRASPPLGSTATQ